MTENQIDHANVKAHPPILMLLHIIAAFLLNWLVPLPVAFPQILRTLGVILVLTGLTFAFTAVRQFTAARTTLDPHGSVAAVVTTGPYRFSRNPIYFGFVCTLVGLPLAMGTYWGIIFSPVFVLLMNQLVIQHEEAYLEEKFKDQYTGYKSRVRRWL